MSVHTENPMPATCNAERLAELAGVSPRYIYQLADKGVIPKPAGRGKYDTVACLSAMLRHKGDQDLKQRHLIAEIEDKEESVLTKRSKRREFESGLVDAEEMYEWNMEYTTGLVKIHDEMERNILRAYPVIADEVMGEVKKASDWARAQGDKLCIRLAVKIEKSKQLADLNASE